MNQREWRRHRHTLRYQRRLSSHRLWSIGLLIAAIGVMFAGFAIAGRGPN